MKFFSKKIPAAYLIISMLLSVQCAVAFSELKAELLQFNPSKMGPALTQTEAHLSLPLIRSEVNNWYHLDTMPVFQEFTEKISTKEQDYLDCCYTFYTGTTNTWITLGDVYKKLYELFHQTLLSNIRVFKWLPAPKKTTLDLLRSEFAKGGMINDNSVALKSYLISANLAPWGNVSFPGECTAEYILNAKSNTPLNDRFYLQTLALFGLSETDAQQFIPELKELPTFLNVTLKKPKEGSWSPQTLTQIFIPKAVADKIAYIAWVQGVPFEESLISWVENKSKKSFGKAPLYTATMQALDDIRAEFLKTNGAHPVHTAMLTGIMQNRYIPSKFLELYRHAPHLVPNLNFMQARINLYFDDIEKLRTSGIKMFDYRLTTPEQEKNYQEALNTQDFLKSMKDCI